jgi:hypothetical protein
VTHREPSRREVVEALSEELAGAGVDAGTLRNRIRADIAWMQVVRVSAAPIHPGVKDPLAPRRDKDDGPSWRE